MGPAWRERRVRRNRVVAGGDEVVQAQKVPQLSLHIYDGQVREQCPRRPSHRRD